MRDNSIEQERQAPTPAISVSLFAGLDQVTTALVVEHLTEETVPSGQVIFEDKSHGDTLYIVKSGRVQVSRILDNGQEHVLAELGPDEFFGEMALLNEQLRSAQVAASAPTCLLAMSRRGFNDLIEHHPVVALNFLKVVSARLRERNQLQEDLLQELASKNDELEQALTKLRAAMKTVQEHERVKRDLEIAHDIQQQMLPATFPQLPELQLHAMTVPSRGVGGDLYDTVCLHPQRLGLLLGDVSGKGIPAAMQMARIMGEFRACVNHQAEPEAVLQVLNELLCQRNTQRTSFVTIQYLLLDLAQRHMRFICAGHPPILLCHADGQIERLGTLPNLPLGIDDTFAYQQEEYWLQPGDRLLLYSDGAYELPNAQGEAFGLSRLADLFAAAPSSPKETVDTIQGGLCAFNQEYTTHDDTTLMCLRLTPA